jgi:hypothetical protein
MRARSGAYGDSGVVFKSGMTVTLGGHCGAAVTVAYNMVSPIALPVLRDMSFI